MNFPSLSWYDSGEEVVKGAIKTRVVPPSFLGRLFEAGLASADTNDLSRTDTAESDSLAASHKSEIDSLQTNQKYEIDSLEASCPSDVDTIETCQKSVDATAGSIGESFSTPVKSTECVHMLAPDMTPETTEGSFTFPETPETEEESAYSEGDVGAEVVHNLSSFMSSESPSEAYSNDIARFQIKQSPQTSPDFSLRETEKAALLKNKKHLSPFAYGKKLTAASIIFALIGAILAVVSKRSLAFVRLENRIEISPQLNQVEYIGLVHLKLCYNETSLTSAERRTTENTNPFLRRLSTEATPTVPAGQAEAHHDQTGCFVLRLTTETVDDTMWNVSRSFLTLAIAFGSFFFVMLCSSIYWESINLKPIALGLLVTYFFQSLSFFFFDSDVCRDNICRLAEGSITSIIASLCWFLSGLCCIRMDVLYQAEQRKWGRRRKRAIKKLKLQRKYSEATAETTTTSVDDSSPVSSDRRNLAFIFDEEAQEVVDLHNWLGGGNQGEARYQGGNGVLGESKSTEYHC